MQGEAGEITVERKGEITEITFPTGDGVRVRVEVSNSAAQTLVGKLMQVLGTSNVTGGQIFNGPRLLSFVNPQTGIRRSPSGTVDIALLHHGLLPIVAEYAPENARVIRDAISAAIGEPPGPALRHRTF